MAKQRVKSKPMPRRRPRWRWAAAGGVVLVAVIAVGLWWFSEARDIAGGTPRLVVDRTEVDLGILRFEVPARVVFTLANTGDGLLKLREVPPVKVLKGC
jgi:hypothetical protein